MNGSTTDLKATLDVIIVNWNTGEALSKCISSIGESSKENFLLSRVIVVDNASSDLSASSLPDIDAPVQVTFNAVNRGFAAACNQGARLGISSYILFLNPDVELTRSSLETSLPFLMKNEERGVGIVGIQLRNERGEVSASCARFMTPTTMLNKASGLSALFPRRFPQSLMVDWDHDVSRPVDQVMGAFFLTSRKLYEKLGGFDERFFVYYEEMDFAFRARVRGYASYFLSSTHAYHEGGGSSKKAVTRRSVYNSWSKLQYAQKHFGLVGKCVAMATVFLLEPLSRTAIATIRGDKAAVVAAIMSSIDLFRIAVRLAPRPEGGNTPAGNHNRRKVSNER